VWRPWSVATRALPQASTIGEYAIDVEGFEDSPGLRATRVSPMLALGAEWGHRSRALCLVRSVHRPTVPSHRGHGCFVARDVQDRRRGRKEDRPEDRESTRA